MFDGDPSLQKLGRNLGLLALKNLAAQKRHNSVMVKRQTWVVQVGSGVTEFAAA